MVLATGVVAFAGPRNDGGAAPIASTFVAVQRVIDPPAIATMHADDRPRRDERRRRRPVRMHRELLDFAPVIPVPRAAD